MLIQHLDPGFELQVFSHDFVALLLVGEEFLFQRLHETLGDAKVGSVLACADAFDHPGKHDFEFSDGVHL